MTMHTGVSPYRMKIKILIISILLSASAGYSASITKEKVIEAVQNLKAACAAPETDKAPKIYSKAAAMMLYTGPDKKRRFKVPVNYNLEGDQQVVESICSRINGIGEISTWGDYQVKGKGAEKWHAIYFTHVVNGEEKKNLFAFMVVRGKLYLGDID